MNQFLKYLAAPVLILVVYLVLRAGEPIECDKCSN